MSTHTKIIWCNHTFNPWEGCTKVSPGCAHCYAEARNARFGGGTAPNWGPGAPRRRTSAANWKQPLKWDRDYTKALDAHAEACAEDFAYGMHVKPPHRPRVFCASLADWLDDTVPIEWLADLLTLIRKTPHLDWLLLTKRPEKWKLRINAVSGCYDLTTAEGKASWAWAAEWYIKNKPPANLWAGTSVEDQQRANERIPALLEIPAHVRFLSCEPLLGTVNLVQSEALFTDRNGRIAPNPPDSTAFFSVIHWVILGGESGPKARPCQVEHVRDVMTQCRRTGVACFVKQLGARPYSFEDPVVLHSSKALNMEVPPRWQYDWRLADKKGGDMAEWPADLRVREFPSR